MIVCVDSNNGISSKGKIPWHVSEDMKHFRCLTDGGIVVMGRKTFETIGKPLMNRDNFILSRSGITFYNTLYSEKYPNGYSMTIHGQQFSDDLIKSIPRLVDKTVWVIGGKQIYDSLLPLCNEIHLTRLDQSYGCDLFLDNLPSWNIIHESMLTDHARYQILLRSV